MKLTGELSVDTGDFVVEHLTSSSEHTALLDSFRAGKNAQGLQDYLRYVAPDDERSGESRTYLVRDSLTGELACYFSLRTCLVPVPVSDEFIATIPGIELANFAVNEGYRQEQRAVKKIGAYAFLYFVLPIVSHVARLVGAKWLCIYALPASKLIGYYETLGFRRLDPRHEQFVYSNVKPKYDQGCVFMYQNLPAGSE